MTATPSNHSYSAIALSLVPKLAALVFLALWLTGTGYTSAGKLSLAFGVLALFDAVTLASLSKGSAAVDWSDITSIIGSLLGPAVLPLYAIVIAGVITLGGTEPPEMKRILSGPGTERLASSAPSRFTAPTRNPSLPGPSQLSSSSISTGTNPGARPGPTSFPPRPQEPGFNAGRPTTAASNPSRPVGTGSPNQRNLTKDTSTPTPAPASSPPAVSSSGLAPKPASATMPAPSAPAAKP